MNVFDPNSFLEKKLFHLLPLLKKNLGNIKFILCSLKSSNPILPQLYLDLKCAFFEVLMTCIFFLEKKELRIQLCEVSDQFLINDRTIRVWYSSENVTNVQVRGIVQSHRSTGFFTFSLPPGLNEIEVVFSGYNYAIARKFQFSVIRVGFDKELRQKELVSHEYPSIMSNSVNVTTLNPIQTCIPRSIIVIRGYSLSAKTIKLNFPYPNIEKQQSNEQSLLSNA